MLSPAGGREGPGAWPTRLGPWLARVRLHAIEPRRGPGGARMIAKRRRRSAPPLIAAGNLLLRLLGAGVRVLPGPEWEARERAVNRALYGIEPGRGPGGWLLIPEWPGAVLADDARRRAAAGTDQLRGLVAAARALERLHGAEVVLPCGAREGLTHGDATLRNVLFDAASGEARWFDFDTAHEPGRSPGWRRADDLRALVYSAVATFDHLPTARVLDAVRGGYAAPAPWGGLRDRLAREPLHRSPWHAAQGCPPAARRRELESLLLDAAREGRP